MGQLRFEPFHPSLDPAMAVMVDGYAPGFRTISHWPGHSTPAPLRHDLTTGSALLYAAMSEAERERAMGEFSVVTNNHFDADGALSLFAMLRPEVAERHADLMLRAARAGDFAVWSGADALALELDVMCDLGAFWPFSTPPFDAKRLGNLSKAYLQVFDRMESLLDDPFCLREKWSHRFDAVVADVERIDAGVDISVTAYAEDDLAVVETDRPATIFGLRRAAGDLFRVLLVHPGRGGNRYRFCFRGESWWDVVSVRPQPRFRLESVARRLNALEQGATRWWASPPHWAVPELGFGEPVTFQNQAARFDPMTGEDPASALPIEVVLRELRQAFRRAEPFRPVAFIGGEP
jgi:hypothetical protein